MLPCHSNINVFRMTFLPCPCHQNNLVEVIFVSNFYPNILETSSIIGVSHYHLVYLDWIPNINMCWYMTPAISLRNHTSAGRVCIPHPNLVGAMFADVLTLTDARPIAVTVLAKMHIRFFCYRWFGINCVYQMTSRKWPRRLHLKSDNPLLLIMTLLITVNGELDNEVSSPCYI